MNCKRNVLNIIKKKKKNWLSWNDIGTNTLTTMVLIIVEMIITNGIIVVSNIAIITKTTKIKLK